MLSLDLVCLLSLIIRPKKRLSVSLLELIIQHPLFKNTPIPTSLFDTSLLEITVPAAPRGLIPNA